MSSDRSPAEESALPLPQQQQIDRLADEFERAWKNGQSPRIEDCLDRVDEAWRVHLLEELLAVEFDLLRTRDVTVDVEAYRRRFPGCEAAVRAAVALSNRRSQRAEGDAADESAGKHDEGKMPLPERIGRFPVRRRLGKGGFGVVYLAHDPGLDRLVALKVPRGELLATGQQRESFLHEARTAAKLKHPSLVMVHEIQHDGDQIYIVQEYIEGCNLAQWASAQPRSWDEIARRMIEITTAIGYVHQQGFYHRDLKPGNILIDAEDHAYVADFGLAVHEDALRLLKGKAPGTPPYMSPEQIRGETHWID
ncbi:MAG: serine/threonine protein kinase, partial [Planctomycetes bacterium]|nr:serine/threonine protein kinase [Planctomycetota bacterium]